MIYDTFGAHGNCKGCSCVTAWHIGGDYPLCPSCAYSLVDDMRALQKKETNEKEQTSDGERREDESTLLPVTLFDAERSRMPFIGEITRQQARDLGLID